MKIELNEPFKSVWKSGYLVNGSKSAGTGRKMVQLYNSHKHRTTISYARYLWIINYGDIPEGYEVDHINHDRTDDRLENLQLLGRSENVERSAKPQQFVHKTCPVCSKPFKVRKGAEATKTCGRSCGGKLSWVIQRRNNDKINR